MRRRFGVEYTLAGLDLLLHRIGWSVQVPARKATDRDEDRIGAWKDEQWPVIKGRRRTWAPGSASKTKPARACRRHTPGAGEPRPGRSGPTIRQLPSAGPRPPGSAPYPDPGGRARSRLRRSGSARTPCGDGDSAVGRRRRDTPCRRGDRRHTSRRAVGEYLHA
ncbi:winged helix-turn-helix domain-containing protein [Streptomyces sp. NPDC005989]|uniref:helix-turn-helix domain-containing protein n=1 Tax=unclassified Streptomyces TaxID=2593676 RepID=UPI0033D2808D